MCDQQRLRAACAYVQTDQSLCLLLEYSMSFKLLIGHRLEFLSLKWGCKGSSESTLVKMPHCWKSHVAVHMYSLYFSVLMRLYLKYSRLLRTTQIQPLFVLILNCVMVCLSFLNLKIWAIILVPLILMHLQMQRDVWLDNVINLRQQSCYILSQTRRHYVTSFFIGWQVNICSWT